jgi:hypothetical protein
MEQYKQILLISICFFGQNKLTQVFGFPPKPLIFASSSSFITMEAETRRKVEDMVLDILQKSDIQETTEFTIRVAASERLGIDLSGPETKRFVRTIIETYLLSIATAQKSPPQLSTEVPVTPNEPPQVSNEPVNVTAPKEQPQELNKVAGVKRKNDDSDKVICQVNQSLFFITT